jgi:hypothetical protein
MPDTPAAAGPARLVSGPRLAVGALIICSTFITLNERGTVLSTSTYAAIKRSQHPPPSVSEEEQLTALHTSNPPPTSPPPPATQGVHTEPTSMRETRRVGRSATTKENSRGWRRSLPDIIAASAVWFEHERTLSEIFADVPTGGVVWLTFANSAFQDFAINWAAHVYRLRKERHMAIAALDQPFQRRLLSEGLPYFGYDHGRVGDLRSSVTEFRRLGALKGALVLQVLRAERHVLLSDVDVIWLADPTRVLASLSLHADVMSATDCLTIKGDEAKFPKRFLGTNRCAYNPGNGEGHAAFNTGVVYFRPSREAKAFAAAWRNRLLSVEKSAWLDDQLAFNELVWHGFRNHPRKRVRAASPDGKVIWVRMGRRGDDSQSPGGKTTDVSQEPGEASFELGDVRHVPDPRPPPAWRNGWEDLTRNPDEAFVPQANSSAVGRTGRAERGSEATGGDRSGAVGAMPVAYRLAPLPARHFCSGHLYWEQQGLRPVECMSVHTTFVEGGNAGKLWRFREAGLWLLEPPEHFAPSADAKYLTFNPPQPPKEHELWPLINRTRCPTDAGPHAPCPYTDKYKVSPARAPPRRVCAGPRDDSCSGSIMLLVDP